jgi:hypothetical protein
VSQTDIASGHFSAHLAQGHPYPGTADISTVDATLNGAYFSFDGYSADYGFHYHLLTRGRSDEGNLQLYFFTPGDGYVMVPTLNCTIARN